MPPIRITRPDNTLVYMILVYTLAFALAVAVAITVATVVGSVAGGSAGPWICVPSRNNAFFW